MKTNLENASGLKNVLEDDCAASGQLVSVQKSSVFFSPNTDVEVRERRCVMN